MVKFDPDEDATVSFMRYLENNGNIIYFTSKHKQNFDEKRIDWAFKNLNFTEMTMYQDYHNKGQSDLD